MFKISDKVVTISRDRKDEFQWNRKTCDIPKNILKNHTVYVVEKIFPWTVGFGIRLVGEYTCFNKKTKKEVGYNCTYFRKLEEIQEKNNKFSEL